MITVSLLVATNSSHVSLPNLNLPLRLIFSSEQLFAKSDDFFLHSFSTKTTSVPILKLISLLPLAPQSYTNRFIPLQDTPQRL